MCESSQISSNPTPISPPSPATITLLDPPQLSSAETIQGPCLTLKPIKPIMDHLGSLNVWLTFFSIHRIIVVLQSRSFFPIYSISNPPLPSPPLGYLCRIPLRPPIPRILLHCCLHLATIASTPPPRGANACPRTCVSSCLLYRLTVLVAPFKIAPDYNGISIK